MKIKELLTESNWIQGAEAETSKGLKCYANNPDATCFCLYGAIIKCYGDNKLDVYEKIIEELYLPNYYGNVIHWNDAPERNFNDIKNLIEKLDI